jgi:hypothetical protein
MQKHSLLSVAIGLAFVSMAAEADYTLAKSKSAGVQVDVAGETVNSENWCQPSMVLSFKPIEASDAPNKGTVTQLMAKVGALLAQQCASAKDVSIISLDSKGIAAFKATSNKANDWALTIAQMKQENDIPKVIDAKSQPKTETSKAEEKNNEPVMPPVLSQFNHPDNSWVMILAYAAKHGLRLSGIEDTQKAYLAAYTLATASKDWRVIKQKTKDEFAVKELIHIIKD